MNAWVLKNKQRIEIAIAVVLVMGCSLFVAEPATKLVIGIFADFAERIISNCPIKM
jgi:hypothetical protein